MAARHIFGMQGTEFEFSSTCIQHHTAQLTMQLICHKIIFHIMNVLNSTYLIWYEVKWVMQKRYSVKIKKIKWLQSNFNEFFQNDEPQNHSTIVGNASKYFSSTSLLLPTRPLSNM